MRNQTATGRPHYKAQKGWFLIRGATPFVLNRLDAPSRRARSVRSDGGASSLPIN